MYINSIQNLPLYFQKYKILKRNSYTFVLKITEVSSSAFDKNILKN